MLGALVPAIIGDMALSDHLWPAHNRHPRHRRGGRTGLRVAGRPAGGQPLLAASFAVTSLSMGALAVAPSYGWLLLAAAPAGLPTTVANPATNQLVSRHVPRGRQGVVIGVKQAPNLHL